MLLSLMVMLPLPLIFPQHKELPLVTVFTENKCWSSSSYKWSAAFLDLSSQDRNIKEKITVNQAITHIAHSRRWRGPESFHILLIHHISAVSHLMKTFFPFQGYGFKPKYDGEDLAYTVKNLRRSTKYKFKVSFESPWKVYCSYCSVLKPSTCLILIILNLKIFWPFLVSFIVLLSYYIIMLLKLYVFKFKAVLMFNKTL